jgi:hypothetical protein
MATTRMVREVSPIPPGRYWICVLGRDKQAAFDSWIADMRGAIQVEATSLNDAVPSTEFVIFRVPEGRSPFMNAWEFGYPNTAPPEITSLEDVEKAQHEPDPLSQAPGDWLSSVVPNLDGSSALLLILGLILLLKS